MDLLCIELLVDGKVVQETLNRIGIINRKTKIIYPSCYLYEDDDGLYITHFKQLFMLTRENSYDNVSETDINRRNAIAYCLSKWGLIDVDEDDIIPHDMFVHVIPFKEKHEWKVEHKINLNILN